MTRFFVSALLCLSLPTQSLALSCMQWDAANVYQNAAEAEERYVIVQGSFLRTGPDQITGDNPDGADPFTYTAHFYGNLASRTGFHTPADFEVEMQVSCAASWCGGVIPDGQQILAFLQVDDNRDYSLDIGPCPFHIIADPSPQVLDQITGCIRNGC